MRTVDRNKQYIYFSNQTGLTEITDSYGNATGQYSPTYSNVARVRMNESAARGTADVEMFGINANYSKTLVTSLLNLSMSEKSVVWIGYGKVDSFAVTENYTMGDMVMYETSLYVCKSSHLGAWNPNNFLAIPYNYIVVGVAKSLNSVTYAVKEVEVNG